MDLGIQVFRPTPYCTLKVMYLIRGHEPDPTEPNPNGATPRVQDGTIPSARGSSRAQKGMAGLLRDAIRVIEMMSYDVDLKQERPAPVPRFLG